MLAVARGDCIKNVAVFGSKTCNSTSTSIIEVAFDEPPSGRSSPTFFVGVDELSTFRTFIGVVLADVGVVNA